ncbi:MAG: T9SS type A sorting domain-containing protein, partial [Bacteroidota bacterium]|nr:T9SS type A sorting domain-containing protein [Bacteroidota bacterium]
SVNAQQRTFSAGKADIISNFSTNKNTTPNDTLQYMDEGAIYNVTGGGYVAGVNKYGDLGKYQRFDINQTMLLKEVWLYTKVNPIVGTPDTISIVIRKVAADSTPSTALSIVKVTTAALNALGWSKITLPVAVPVGAPVYIGFEWKASIKDTFCVVNDKINLGYGQGQKRAWEKWSDGTFASMNSSWQGFDVDLWIAAVAEKVLPISVAREDLNNDLIPDRKGDTLTVKGVVISPNFQTSSRSYYIYDGTAGICLFKNGMLSPALNLGDSVVVKGKIDHYNGLTELVYLSDSTIWVVGNNAALPAPKVLTLSQYKANPEAYEGQLIGILNLNKISGNWPAANASATLKMGAAPDTLDLRIDSDTDIDGTTEPTWPKDVIGIASQFASTGSVNNGYQLLPRYAATDFLAPNSLPVELTSFSANVNGNSVLLTWSTATEKNNMGFEVQRSVNNNNFVSVGFVNGKGTSTSVNNYSFVDNTLSLAKCYYRLRQVDYNGNFEFSPVIEVESIGISNYTLSQNYPNPFNPSTQIKFALPKDGFVTLKVFNVLGKEVASLVNEQKAAGNYTINFSAKNLSSGIYFYTIKSGNFTQTKKMTILK